MRKKILFAAFLVLLISTIGCTQQSTPESDTPQTVTGRVVTSIKEPSGSEEANYDICNNAQTYGQCAQLITTFNQGYKEGCCEEYGLCC